MLWRSAAISYRLSAGSLSEQRAQAAADGPPIKFFTVSRSASRAKGFAICTSTADRSTVMVSPKPVSNIVFGGRVHQSQPPRDFVSGIEGIR